MIDVNTVIGAPIAAGDVTDHSRHEGLHRLRRWRQRLRNEELSGKPGQCLRRRRRRGVNITPVAFLVVRGESVRMLPVAEPASTSMDRLIEQLPDLLDKAEHLLKQKRLAKEEGIE